MKIVDYLNGSKKQPAARRYLSLHSFGGAVAPNTTNEDRSCFAFRKKPFMLQYQAWWGNKEDEDRCLDWVSGFRKDMQGYTEGSFINFPDVDIPVADYYGHNFRDLVQVRSQYDPNAVFQFPMSIPGFC